MALFWSKKPKAEKNYDAEKKAVGASTKGKKAAAKPAKAGSAVATTATKAVAAVKGSFADHTDAIVSPHVTEKSGIQSQSGIYTFKVAKTATKGQVAAAVKTLYKVTPVRVAMVNLPAKNVFVRGRYGVVPGLRKAVVTVKKGEKIDFV